MYFCTACNVYVKEEEGGAHDQSIAHMMSTSKAPALKKGESYLRAQLFDDPRDSLCLFA